MASFIQFAETSKTDMFIRKYEEFGCLFAPSEHCNYKSVLQVIHKILLYYYIFIKLFLFLLLLCEMLLDTRTFLSGSSDV